jgi:hypothetical protein
MPNPFQQISMITGSPIIEIYSNMHPFIWRHLITRINSRLHFQKRLSVAIHTRTQFK